MTKNETKYGYLAKNTTLLAISSFGSTLLSFFLVPLYTNVLTTAEYGIADIISTSGSLLLYVFTLNISLAVLRFAIDKNYDKEKVLLVGLQIIFGGTIVLALCLYAIYKINIIPWNRSYFFVLHLLFLLEALQSLCSNYLRAIDKVHVMAIAGIISTLTRLICNIIFLIVLKLGLTGYFLSMLLAPVSYIICSFVGNKRVRIQISEFKIEKKLYKEMLRYCIPSAFGQLAWWMNNSIDRYFVVGMCGESVNGIYSVSYKIPNVFNVVINLFMQAWGISALKEFGKEDSVGFFSNIYKMLNAVLSCLCTLFILINIPISKLLFGKDFWSAWESASILLLGMVFSGLSSFFASVFSAAKESKILATTTIAAAGINIVLNWGLIPVWGAQGAAIATVASFYFLYLVRLIIVRRYIKLNIQIVQNHVVYLLIIFQILCEHGESHFYLGQFVAFLLIIILLFKNIIYILNSLFKKMRKS